MGVTRAAIFFDADAASCCCDDGFFLIPNVTGDVIQESCSPCPFSSDPFDLLCYWTRTKLAWFWYGLFIPYLLRMGAMEGIRHAFKKFCGFTLADMEDAIKENTLSQSLLQGEDEQGEEGTLKPSLLE